MAYENHTGHTGHTGLTDRTERDGDDVTLSSANASLGDTDDVQRVELREPLPCARRCCGAPAWAALAEVDPAFPGMWLLIPLCGAHDRRAD